MATAASGMAQTRKDSLSADAGKIVFTKVDKPAEFPGGAQGWLNYL
jgi:hypothetical protein